MRSQTIGSLGPEVVTRWFPSGEKANDQTGLEDVRECSNSPEAASYRLMPAGRAATASFFPSGENAMAWPGLAKDFNFAPVRQFQRLTSPATLRNSKGLEVETAMIDSMLDNAETCPGKLVRGCQFSVFQRRVPPTPEVIRRLASGEKATDQTNPSAAGSVVTSVSRVASQTLTVRSSLPVAMSLPSGEKFAQVTIHSWPVRVAS